MLKIYLVWISWFIYEGQLMHQISRMNRDFHLNAIVEKLTD